jgi:hypothetical protein
MDPQFPLPGFTCSSIIVSSFIILVWCFCVVVFVGNRFCVFLVVPVEHRDVTAQL